MVKTGFIAQMQCFWLAIVGSLWLFACEPAPSHSGFATMLTRQGKAVTLPARLQFPRDHLAHPEFGIEWWYLTANLSNQQNDPIWLQWTLFRVRNQQADNSWSDGQFYMAHFSLHSLKHHVFREVFASGGVGNAAVTQQAININNWQLHKTASGLPSGLTLSYSDSTTNSNVSVELALDTKADYLLHGDGGYSLKHPQTELASYYYSLPHIRVSGSLSFSNENHEVSGDAWYDHEWSSAFLSEDFTGWNWFSIHLQDGSKLTLFTLLPAQQSNYSQIWYGALMTADGATTKLPARDIKVGEQSWQDSQIGMLPTSWRIKIDSLSLDLNVQVKKPQQISPFSVPYYEGAIEVVGTKSGIGFVELTR